MIKVTVYTLFIAHVIWFPLWAIMFSVVNDDAAFLVLIPCFFGGWIAEFYALDAFRQSEDIHAEWHHYAIIWMVLLLFSPAITAYSYGHLFLL